jgi:hypothetical protein
MDADTSFVEPVIVMRMGVAGGMVIALFSETFRLAFVPDACIASSL